MDGSNSNKIKVFYNSLATDAIYEAMRLSCPADIELVLLDRDDDEERTEKISQCRAVLVAATPLTRSLVEAAPELELVQHQGVGYHDTVDTTPLKERGIRLALTTAGTVSVAEHALMLALAACRRLSFADAELRQGRWHYNDLRPVSIGIKGKTIGYIGMGRIAQETAKRFRAFETTGLYFDPYITLDSRKEENLGIKKSSFKHLLKECDIITIHAPLTADTRSLLGREQFALMKPRSVLVNTARGEIIDEEALYEGLRIGRPSAAGLDVFSNEPIQPSSPLLSLPNIVLSPHISAGTWDTLEEKMSTALQNISSFFRGHGLQNEVKLTG